MTPELPSELLHLLRTMQPDGIIAVTMLMYGLAIAVVTSAVTVFLALLAFNWFTRRR